MNPLNARFNSVRGSLAFLVGALTCASLLAGLVLVLRAYQQGNAAVSRQLQSTARALSIGVDVHLRQYIRMLHALAASPELESRDLGEFERRARSISLPRNVWISFADTQGNQLINTRLDPGMAIPSFTVEEDLAAAMQRGETYISNFKMGALQRPILFITVPVNGGSNLLGCAFDPESFSQNFALRRMAGNNLIAIVDRAGVIAARSRDPEKFIGRQAAPSFWKTVSSERQGVIQSVTLDGVSVLTAFQRSELSGWTIVHSAPLSLASASARKLLLVAGLLSACSLVIAIFLARWIGHGVVRAVNSLVSLAAEIGHGAVSKSFATGLAETDMIAHSLRSAGERLIAHERELHDLNQSLEQRVRTRTSQLITTSRELATTNRELEEFARVAAHDLREPLRTISGFATSLADDFTSELPPLARKYIGRIHAAAQRMNRLLESVFEYSRASSSAVVMEQVDLNLVLDDVRDDLESRLKESGGQVRSTPLACVAGDSRQLHQLLLNLVGNALKFQRKGVAPLVEVDTIRQGEQVRLIVSDNGIGFDPNLSQQLFRPFHRLENASDYEGTGIGLAVVRRIAERHGGTVRAVSSLGAGSRFEVTLPGGRDQPLPARGSIRPESVADEARSLTRRSDSGSRSEAAGMN